MATWEEIKAKRKKQIAAPTEKSWQDVKRSRGFTSVESVPQNNPALPNTDVLAYKSGQANTLYDPLTKSYPRDPNKSIFSLQNVGAALGGEKDVQKFKENYHPTILSRAGDIVANVGEKVGNAMDWTGGNIAAGLGQAELAVSGTARALGANNVPFLKNALDIGDVKPKQWIKAAEWTNRNLGTVGKLGAQAIQALPQAAENLALLFLSKGTSAPAQLNAATGTTAANILKTVKSPSFINSMVNTFGSTYNQAKESGATEEQAVTAALLDSIPESFIEVGGGVEGIVDDLIANKGFWKTVGKAAGEEAIEELKQYPFQGLAQKATYAPETPIFSTTEQAIINPVQMAENATVGGLVGGVLGGASNVMTGKPGKAPVQTVQQAAPQPALSSQLTGLPETDKYVKSLYNKYGDNFIKKTSPEERQNILRTLEAEKAGKSIPAATPQFPIAQSQAAATEAPHFPIANQAQQNFPVAKAEAPQTQWFPVANQTTSPAFPVVNQAQTTIPMPKQTINQGSQAEQAATKKQLPEMDGNTIKLLKNYSNTLYHETSLDAALPMIDRNYMVDMPGDIYMSNNKDLALGQGDNTGVLIEFVPNNSIKGFINTSKPTWKLSYENGDAEFVARYNKQSDFIDSVKSVTIKSNAKGEKATTVRMKRILSDWAKTKNADGSTTYLKPTKEPTRTLAEDVGLNEPSLTADEHQPVQYKAYQDKALSIEEEYNKYIVEGKELPNDPDELSSMLAEVESKKDDPSITIDLQLFGTKLSQKLAELASMVNKNGALPKGEMPMRDILFPAKTGENFKTRRFARTIAESKHVNDEGLEMIIDKLMRGELGYVPETNKGTIDQAMQFMRDKGESGSLKYWDSVIQSGKVPDRKDVTIGSLLLAKAFEDGDMKLADQLTGQLAAEATRAGQAVQAFSLFKRMTPEGDLVFMQRQIELLNEEMERRKSNQRFEMTPEEAEAMKNAKTKAEREQVMGQIAARIGQEIPARAVDKINSWRYMSMLLNPKTWIRNFMGNLTMLVMRDAKDVVGIAPEILSKWVNETRMANAQTKAAQELQETGEVSKKTTELIKNLKKQEVIRTKAVAVFDPAILEYAKQDYEKNGKKVFNKAGRFDFNNIIMENQRVFDTKTLEYLRHFGMDALNVPDMWFFRGAYVDSFAKVLKANKVTVDMINNNDPKALKIVKFAEEWAMKQGLEATFRDVSKFANWLSKGKQGMGKAGQVVIEGIMPFKKTPINILKRGIEYSPIGVIKGTTDILLNVKNGKMTATQAVDNLSKGLTGCGAAALGALLAALGFLTGKKDEEGRLLAYDNIRGEQGYSINFGGFTYTVDWMQPSIMPVMIGVELYNKLAGGETSASGVLGRTFDVIASMSDPMSDLSMLQGINNAIATYNKDDIGGSLGRIGLNAAESYALQFLPTIGGQLARTISPEVRTTYVNKDTDFFLGAEGERLLKQAAGKIPFVSLFLQPKVDLWGRDMKNDSIAGRAAENFISPGYVKSDKGTAIDTEIERLSGIEGIEPLDIVPKQAPTYIENKGEKLYLTPKELTKWQRTMGQYAYEKASKKIQSSEYKGYSDKGKAKALKKIHDNAREKAKDEFLKGR